MKRDILDAKLFDSRITQENIGRKERFLGYFLGPVSVVFLNSVLNNYLNVYYTDVVQLGNVWNGWFLTAFPIVVKILGSIFRAAFGGQFYSAVFLSVRKQGTDASLDFYQLQFVLFGCVYGL